MGQTLQLEQLLQRARSHKMSPDERRAQRISLVMGLRGNHSTLTKEKVGTLIEEFEGHAS